MRHFPYSLLVLAATAGLASVQASTSYSTPVGYVTENFPANSDKSFAVALERETAIATTATGVAGSVVTIKASGLAANQFQYVAGVQPNTYYLRFTDGSLEGQYFTISTNAASNDNGTPSNLADDTTEVTLDTSVSFAGTPSVKVVPYWTLGTLFPGGEGIGVSTSSNVDPVGFLLTSNQSGTGINRSPAKAYFYSDGTFTDTDGPGFYDFDDVFAGKVDDLIVNHEDLFIVRNNSGSARELEVNGSVPNSSATTSYVYLSSGPNDNYVGQPFPVDMRLYDTDLHLLSSPNDCAVRNSVSAVNPTDFVITYASSPTSVNQSPVKAYFYQDGSDPETPDAGWYDNDDYFSGIIPSTEFTMKAGQGFIIRKGVSGSTGSGLWTAPVPYPLP